MCQIAPVGAASGWAGVRTGALCVVGRPRLLATRDWRPVGLRCADGADMADGLPTAGLHRPAGCAAQWATAPRPASDGGGPSASGPAATQLRLHSVVLDGGVVG